MQQVTIYTTPTCHFCQMTKQFFKENNVKYAEKDVSVNHEAAHEMVHKSGQMGVPVISVVSDSGEEIIVGFDRPRLETMLGLV